jgi:hypothetical protein
MSFEGYMQYLCSQGHEFHADINEGRATCPNCGNDPVWAHTVDQTNGVEEQHQDTFPVALKLKTPRVVSDPYDVLLRAIRESGGVASQGTLTAYAELLNPKTLKVETYHVPTTVGHLL